MRTTPTLYEEVLAIVKIAADNADASAVFRKLDELDFQKVDATDDSFYDGYRRNEGYETVFVQYRFYDTSKTFSIQPDMNVFLVRLLGRETTLKEEKIQFLDKS